LYELGHFLTDLLEATEYGCNMPALKDTCQMALNKTIAANMCCE